MPEKKHFKEKKHDVTIMTSSGSCPIDRPWAHSYRLCFGTMPLSGFVSEIFSAKVATKIITLWRHQWRHKAHINYPWGTYTGCGKKVIPCRILQIFKQPLWIFYETLQLYSLFISTYNCQISFNYLDKWQSYVILNATTPWFWRGEKYLLIVKRQEHITNCTTNFFTTKHY